MTVFGTTIYYAKQFKRSLKRSATLHNRMHNQQSVMVFSGADQKQIKTHPSARQKESMDALKDNYEVLPTEYTVVNTSLKDPRLVVPLYQKQEIFFN